MAAKMRSRSARLGAVALQGGGVLVADLFDCLVKVGLPTTSDENVGSFGDEALGRGQPDAAGAAGDQRDFTGEFAAGLREAVEEEG